MSGDKDLEGTAKKLPYPKAVFFIIICEFCERFCYYGMRTILTLYFVQVLKWSDNQATVVYHAWVMVSYFTPLIGAMLADSLLGKFQTILYLGIVYCAGCVVLALAATPPLNFPVIAISLVGLALISLGTGGIKPCVSAFGADQFKLPEQEVYVASYFAIFYAAINSGSLVSTVLTPILREDVKCFDDDHCYSLAFAIPGGLMIFALIVFVVGRPGYIVNKPEGNVVVQVLGAIKHSLSRRGSEVKAGRARDHWLDYAEDKYGKRFIAEAKVLMKVLFLYIPVPFFWALFDQQGSRWTLQATRMDGDTWGWVIKPDQLQVLNPALVLIFIPIFDRGIYPLLSKFGVLKKPLQRLVMGGIFAGVAFVVSGLVELSLENTYATILKKGESNFHMVNGLPDCPLHMTLDANRKVVIPPNQMEIFEAINARDYPNVKFETFSGEGTCRRTRVHTEPVLTGESEVAKSFMMLWHGDDLKFHHVLDEDDMEKAKSGNPRIRVIYDPANIKENTTVQGFTEKQSFHFELNRLGWTSFGEVEPTKYDFYMSNAENPTGFQLDSLDLKLGAVYLMSVVRNEDKFGESKESYDIVMHQITKANDVHMLLLIPQYIIMTMGEIMFSITIMDFSYAEGPPSMKSVMQSTWLLTVAFGNLIVIIIAEAQIFDKQWKEFFLFAGLMFADMLIFSYMAYKYVPADRFWLRDDEEKEKDEVKALEDEKDEGKENSALEHED
ncbi:solute carrier family 15 member 2 [Folsomia candida]|uniref:Oligopeptide transporter 1 n=1 Tax=Folsomia candida TaxID=158441 RepID=A0A226EFP8_FOLCA|nr:solute carrier family 15 member 2 [Folsomia candida]OXA55937.1 hypothetical protein Fcan01_10004 [Folsomia candida]